MRVRDLTLLALLIALTTAATMAIRIPVPATGGYINLGDSMVYISALLFGPLAGLVAGGIGSALADWFGGYLQFAPYTLVIKGVEGLVVGILAWALLRSSRRQGVAGVIVSIVAICVGGALMVVGYYAVERFIMGQAAAAEVPGNIFQVVCFFFQAEDGIRDLTVTGVQTCALPIWRPPGLERRAPRPAAAPSGRRVGVGEPGRRSDPLGRRDDGRPAAAPAPHARRAREIGRASCRERV